MASYNAEDPLTASTLARIAGVHDRANTRVAKFHCSDRATSYYHPDRRHGVLLTHLRSYDDGDKKGCLDPTSGTAHDKI